MDRITEALRRARHDVRAAVGGRRFVPRPIDLDEERVQGEPRTRELLIPLQTMRDHRLVSGFEPCAYTEAFKILSTQVLLKLTQNGWKTVGVTSPSAHEGKTLVAINLAISLAMEYDRTALLVDCDLKKPAVATQLGVDPGPGLIDYFGRNAPIHSLLVRPNIKGLVVLPGGAPAHNSSEILGSPKMADLVQQLRHRYATRIVVFDLPPLLSTADVLAFAPQVDAALLVVEDGRTRRDDVGRASALLTSTKLIGAVLNKSRNPRPAYGTA